MKKNISFLAQTLSRQHIGNVHACDIIQALWGDYGYLYRLSLDSENYPTVIVKHIELPTMANHPRGWNTPLSHQRKLKSYQVEWAWYQHFAPLCCINDQFASPVPQAMLIQSTPSMLLVLEDLAKLGFNRLCSSPNHQAILSGLTWLANFHGRFLHKKGDAPQHADTLWEIGSYWHLATRPDEFKSLVDSPLKQQAQVIDNVLSQCPYQTFVHGDAKLANFCFSTTMEHAAAVDFQYVGQGCGMKDVAYFLSSVLPFNQPLGTIEARVDDYLTHYFNALSLSITHEHKDIDSQEVIDCWRQLYPIAWADFHRFIKGWSPEHPKINAYSEALTRKALAQLTV